MCVSMSVYVRVGVEEDCEKLVMRICLKMSEDFASFQHSLAVSRNVHSVHLIMYLPLNILYKICILYVFGLTFLKSSSNLMACGSLPSVCCCVLPVSCVCVVFSVLEAVMYACCHSICSQCQTSVVSEQSLSHIHFFLSCLHDSTVAILAWT